MDFGAFLLFICIALAFIAFLPYVVYAFLRRRPQRFRALRILGATAVVLLLLGGLIYKTYFLDEALVAAATNGDVTEVRALLARGANPNATWEDGTSALQNAQKNGHTDVAAALRAAGARQR